MVFKRGKLALSLGLLSSIAVGAAGLLTAKTAAADDITLSTVTSQGISGYQDLRGRDPVLSVSVVSSGPTIKILADAYEKISDYAQDPIEYQFFVNRRLFSTQIQARELPGAVGVDIGQDVAVPPFNYTVIATLLHPNRQFKTVIHGAVYGSNLTASLSCTLEDESDSANPINVSAADVQTVQPAENRVSLSFEGTSGGSSSKTTASLDAEVSGTSLTGTISVSGKSGQNSVDAQGKISFENSQIKSLEMSSSDKKISISCQ